MTVWTILSYAFILSSTVASAALTPTPTTALSCGNQNPRLCANLTTAALPCVTSGDPTTTGQTVGCNVATFNGWPSIVSWDQCKARCKSEKGCVSFSYTFYEPIAEVSFQSGDSVYCQLFNHTVTSYTSECTNDDSTAPLSTFFDVNCPTPALLTTGSVPKTPNTDPMNGTCNGQRVFNFNQAQWNHITIQAEPVGHPLKACSTACSKNKLCKSFYWANQTEGYFDPALSSEQYYPPEQSNGFEAPLCLLLSQPVSSYTVPPGDAYYEAESNQFYDRNCPTS